METETVTFDPQVLKQTLKEALVETIHEERDFLYAVIADVLEDFALSEAISKEHKTEIIRVETLAEEAATYSGGAVKEAAAVVQHKRYQQTGDEQKLAIPLRDRLLRIGQECAALPLVDDRKADEILGYNEIGLPT